MLPSKSNNSESCTGSSSKIRLYEVLDYFCIICFIWSTSSNLLNLFRVRYIENASLRQNVSSTVYLRNFLNSMLINQQGTSSHRNQHAIKQMKKTRVLNIDLARKLIKYNYRSEFFGLSMLMRCTPITEISITKTHILGRKRRSNRGVRGGISKKISFLKCSECTKGQDRTWYDRIG